MTTQATSPQLTTTPTQAGQGRRLKQRRRQLQRRQREPGNHPSTGSVSGGGISGPGGGVSGRQSWQAARAG